ncbi:MAG: hypothetical protein Q4G69_09235 [Planctomycetia bacterium]|nr:hypothetical protein [Planctomycetia bacterium]
MPVRVHFPVAIVHTGNPPYLEYCLRQIRKFNPDTPIYLIGDEANNCFDFVIHRNITDPDLSVDIEKFQSIYEHHSNFALKWERFCLERWIYIRNLLQKEQISGCLAIDSDVLLFCDIDEEAKRFRDYAMTFAHWDQNRNLVHCNFIQDRTVLESFCDYMFQVYEDPAILDRIKKANSKSRNRFWISDMSLFGDWCRNTEFPTAFFEDFYSKEICFDRCIDNGEHFRTQFYFPGLRKYKKILFKEGRPFGYLKDGRKVPFKCLHYHGHFKFLMKDHFQGLHSHWKTFRTLFLHSVFSIPKKLGILIKRERGKL